MAPKARTKKELAEENEALRLSEARYRALFERSRDAIFTSFGDGHVEVNEAAVALLGYTREEFNETARADLFVDSSDWDEVRRQVHEGGEVHDFETVLRTKDGTPIVCLITLVQSADDDGNLLAQQAIIRDVTQVRQSQNALRENEERLRSLVQAMPIPVILTAIDDGQILYANEYVAEMAGLTLQELIGSPILDLYFDPEDRVAYVQELRSQGYLSNRELHMKRGNGEPVWVSVSARPTTYDGREALLASFDDITERKRAEELFQAIAQSSPVGMFMIQEGKFSFVNSRFLEETGYTEDELIGMDSMSLILPEDRPKVRRNAEITLSGGDSTPYEYRGIDKHGNIFWLMGSVTAADFEGSQALVGSYMNITERKQADEQFRQLAQTSPVGIFVTEDGKFKFVNAQALNNSGYALSELLGRYARDFVHSDDKAGLAEYMNRVDAGEDVEPLEYRIFRKDGTPWTILGTFSKTSYEGRPARIGTYMDITDR